MIRRASIAMLLATVGCFSEAPMVGSGSGGETDSETGDTDAGTGSSTGGSEGSGGSSGGTSGGSTSGPTGGSGGSTGTGGSTGGTSTSTGGSGSESGSTGVMGDAPALTPCDEDTECASGVCYLPVAIPGNAKGFCLQECFTTLDCPDPEPMTGIGCGDVFGEGIKVCYHACPQAGVVNGCPNSDGISGYDWLCHDVGGPEYVCFPNE